MGVAGEVDTAERAKKCCDDPFPQGPSRTDRGKVLPKALELTPKSTWLVVTFRPRALIIIPTHKQTDLNLYDTSGQTDKFSDVFAIATPR